MKLDISISAAKRLTVADLEAFVKKNKFSDVDVGKNSITFERAKDGVTFTLALRGNAVDLIVQGNSSDLNVASNITLDEVPTLLKSVNRTWFKTNDPDY